MLGRKGGAGDADASDDWVVAGEGASDLLEGFEGADGEVRGASCGAGCCSVFEEPALLPSSGVNKAADPFIVVAGGSDLLSVHQGDGSGDIVASTGGTLAG